MIAILCITIFVHLALLTVSRAIYTDVVPDELMVKYAQPFTFLLSCLSGLCVETEISIKHKRVAAQCARGDIARRRHKYSLPHDSTFKATIPTSVDLTKEEKEYRKPVLTMLVFLIDAAGRTFIVPYTLVFTADTMLTDEPKIGEAIKILAFLIIALCGSWEIWRGFCKVMEIARKNIPLSDECDNILLSCLDLKATVMSIPSLVSGSIEYEKIIDSYQQIKSQHVLHLSRQLDWWNHNFLSQELPSVGFQRTGLMKEARLMEEHNSLRAIVMYVVNELKDNIEDIDFDVHDKIKQDEDSKFEYLWRQENEKCVLGSLDELNKAFDELFNFVNHLFKAFYPDYQQSIAVLSRKRG